MRGRWLSAADAGTQALAGRAPGQATGTARDWQTGAIPDLPARRRS